MTVTMAPEIRAMLSPEGERVELLKVKATGNVEDWLKQVEKNMITAVRTCIKKAKDDFEKSVREEWLVRHAHQVRQLSLSIVSLKICVFAECADGFANLLVFGIVSNLNERRIGTTEDLARLRTEELSESE